MINSQPKIYFQLAPGVDAREQLSDIVEIISKQQLPLRFVDKDRWHLTVLHIGQLNHIWQQLRVEGCTFSQDKFEDVMIDWVQTLQRQVSTSSFQLQVQQLELFGGQGSVVAAVFKADAKLIKHHNLAYESLVSTWRQLGIDQPKLLIHSMPELKYAHALTPRVTLARDFTGDRTELPNINHNSGRYRFQTMKFIY